MRSEKKRKGIIHIYIYIYEKIKGKKKILLRTICLEFLSRKIIKKKNNKGNRTARYLSPRSTRSKIKKKKKDEKKIL